MPIPKVLFILLLIWVAIFTGLWAYRRVSSKQRNQVQNRRLQIINRLRNNLEDK